MRKTLIVLFAVLAGASQGRDSLNCRLWHVSAATVAPSQHCGHASGEPPCA